MRVRVPYRAAELINIRRLDGNSAVGVQASLQLLAANFGPRSRRVAGIIRANRECLNHGRGLQRVKRSCVPPRLPSRRRLPELVIVLILAGNAIIGRSMPHLKCPECLRRIVVTTNEAVAGQSRCNNCFALISWPDGAVIESTKKVERKRLAPENFKKLVDNAKIHSYIKKRSYRGQS